MTVYLLGKNLDFPDPNTADISGLLAVGGDLSEKRLIKAYENGIFPWYSEESPILWFSPDPRLVIFPLEFKPNKSLLKIVRSEQFQVKFDTNFENVIHNCAKIKRKGQSSTWITEDMTKAYIRLHKSGFAHSVETYKDGKLVGGLYGVSLGGAFFGESMFYKLSNASKVAFYHLVKRCLEWDFDFIDSQIPTKHMKRLGGVEVSRKDFLESLSKTLRRDTKMGPWENY